MVSECRMRWDSPPPNRSGLRVIDQNHAPSVFWRSNFLRRGKSMFHGAYRLIMDSRYNPLANLQDVTTRHLVMQMLAWMWCIIFSMWMGSILVFGVSAAVHAILIAGVFITAATFETARTKPGYFGTLGRANSGEHE